MGLIENGARIEPGQLAAWIGRGALGKRTKQLRVMERP